MGVRDKIEKMIENDDLEGLLTRTGEIHGHHCIGSVMGAIAAHRAMKELDIIESTGMEHIITIVETNNCFSDGVQVVTGCTFGNNALVYRDYGKTALTLIDREGKGVRISAKPEAGEILRDEETESTHLYRKVVEERKATPEEERRMIDLNKKHCYEVLTIDAERIFNIERVNVNPIEYSSILDSEVCDKCGEKVIETRTVKKIGENLCIPCAGSEYHQMDWSGISLKNKK